MRVDLYAPSATTELSNVSAKGSTAPTAAAQTSQSPEDRTTLMSGSDSISSLTSLAMQSGSARADKVQALQQAVSKGEYQPNPSAIADAMVAGN